MIGLGLLGLALLCHVATAAALRIERLPAALRGTPWRAGAAVLHALGLIAGVIEQGALPLESMQWGLASLAFWVVVGAAGVRRRPRMEVLGNTLFGLGLFLLIGALVAPTGADPTRLDPIWFPLHVALILAGFLGFALSFGVSGLYLFVHRRLKRRELADLRRFPSVQALDQWNARAMGAGFVALTAGMLVGGTWALTHPQTSMGPDLTVHGTLAVWIWYAVGLYLRLVAGWQGRLIAVFSVIGFGGMVLLGGLAALLFQGWHGFGGVG